MLLRFDGTEVTTSNKKGEGIICPADLAEDALALSEELKKIGSDGTYCLDGEYFEGKLHVFDLMDENGKELKSLPVSERAELLEVVALASLEAIEGGPVATLEFLPTAHTHLQKRKLFDSLRANNAEGIVFKRKSATMSEGKTNRAVNNKGEIVADYLKFKFLKSVDCIVVPAANGKRAFDCYVYEELGGANTVCIGSVASGVKDSDMEELKNLTASGEKVVAEVRYLYATGEGKTTKGMQLYQSAFLRFRDDKDYDECTIDQLVQTNKEVLTQI
jgi:ATP-dependent DNA ligase